MNFLWTVRSGLTNVFDKPMPRRRWLFALARSMSNSSMLLSEGCRNARIDAADRWTCTVEEKEEEANMLK